MAQQPDAFRDFGLLPQGLPPPPDPIRCFLTGGHILVQYVVTGLVSSVGLGLAALLVLMLPWPLNWLGGAAALAGFGAFVYLATHNDYRWVELGGTTLRAKQLYTGRVVERPLEDIRCLATMFYQVRRPETVVIEALMGRVKGVEVQFRDRRTPLRILRADPAMTNARELIEAILYRMARIREIETDIIDFAGQPLVRSNHWQGETPGSASDKTLKVCLGCSVGIALLFGSILGFWGRQEHRRLVLGSVPAQEIPLQTLIENGPGANPHVALTNVRFGGYVYEERSGSWTSVWIALFPERQAGPEPGKHAEGPEEIKAVLSSHTIPDEASLRQFMQRARVTGICSDAPRSNYGLTLGPKRKEMNPGSELSSAWLIEDLSEPPSAAQVQWIFLGSAVCYGLVVVLAMLIFITS
jgi:hypothetical protein